jgi:hypothetical protein
MKHCCNIVDHFKRLDTLLMLKSETESRVKLIINQIRNMLFAIRPKTEVCNLKLSRDKA